MSVVHVITHENRHLYDEEMEQHFRLRHKIFVEERGWRELARDDGREIDAYDDGHSEYLLAIDNGRVVGGMRFRSTLRSNMLGDIFSELVDSDIPCARDVLECSRYFVIRDRRAGRVDLRLLAAAQAYCLEEKISEMTAVVETWWLARWHHVGFRVCPLGAPKMIANQPTIAVSIEVRPETLHFVLRQARLRGTPLVRQGLAAFNAKTAA
ncbi:isovaleryl-homoserine lactone synthase [Variibacter gotjawalensis]|uniref:Isovaleryl-homoserine lactone synthase n=1 Tax=Variibacter gotjawalensis TaxID=1333996 RepID=A0A0S3PZT8_9BRAD|nr:acyl-homoserine-lactone synthase [Variibacter gotjawalensis]NIK47285.1 acyl-homoserine lactone synthase [Variibacter gotjawalensis]RZS49185.1 acyl-homoserine lactone synthase [Variibacter gotjawalensis]BAT61447.1 isovaleryl-homoserine lactone synthase [Variibacter gotjawalensis]